jgi:hypothetical protein
MKIQPGRPTARVVTTKATVGLLQPDEGEINFR